MRGSELLEQMEQVDPAYVMDADAPPKKKKSWAWAAVAAVLCLVLGGWLIWNFRGVFLFGGNNTQGPVRLYRVGSEIKSGSGTLIFHTNDPENCIVAFTLILERDTPYNTAYIKGYQCIPVEYEIINGEQVVVESEYVRVTAGTPANLIDYVNQDHAGQWDLLVVTVDGKPATYLPTKPGTYEIQLDYSKMYEQCIYLDEYISLDRFGHLWIK